MRITKKGFITASTGLMIGIIIASILWFLAILLIEKLGLDLTPILRAIPLPGLPAEPLGIGEAIGGVAQKAGEAASGVQIPGFGGS